MTNFLLFNKFKVIDFHIKMIDYQSEMTDCKAKSHSLIEIMKNFN